MTSRRALMAGTAGLMASLSGCAGVLGGDDGVFLDLTVSTQLRRDVTARIVIQDADQETLYNEEFDIEDTPEPPALDERGIVSGEHNQELTARVRLPEHDTEQVETFSLDCSPEQREEGLTTNDSLFVVIVSEDQIQISHNGCT